MDMGGNKMKKNDIPSEQDFARAIAADEERNRGLSEVRSQILSLFQRDGLHEAFVFYSPLNDSYGVYLFFLRNDQIKEADKSGLASQIKQAVLEALESVGRGNRETITVDFEFDSHENVEANFEGDYYLRLR
jgi:hypothetical protein